MQYVQSKVQTAIGECQIDKKKAFPLIISENV